MRSSFHTCYMCVTSDGNTVYFSQLLQLLQLLLLLVQLAGSHQTHPSDPSQNDGAGPAAGVQTLLTKEEVKFVVVLFCAVGDLLDLNKHRLWGINTDEPAEGLGKWLSNKMRGASTCNQSHLTPPHPPPPARPPRPELLTVEPPGVILLRPDGCPPPHGPKQSSVCAHEVDVDPGIEVTIYRDTGTQGHRRPEDSGDDDADVAADVNTLCETFGLTD